jgi:hypothetical protein
MSEKEINEKKFLRKWIIIVINIILCVSLFSTVFYVFSVIMIPTAKEYDDPNTDDQESFPWNPSVYTELDKVLRLYFSALLRHLSLFTFYVNTAVMITWVSRIFYLVFIYSIRNTLLEREKFGIHNYVEFGIGSIIGSILYISGTTYFRELPDASIAIVYLTIASVILYSYHPHLGLFVAIKNRIEKGISPESHTTDKKHTEIP